MFGRKPVVEAPAPLKVELELWPEQFRGRATVTRQGKRRDVEITAPYMKLALNLLRLAGIQV